jgi:hypothetical protein
MGCISSKPTPSDPLPPVHPVSQRHRPHGETIEPRQVSPPPDPPHRTYTTPAPADLVQPDQLVSEPIPLEPDNTSQRQPPVSGRSKSPHAPRGLAKATSTSLHHLGGWQVSEGETLRKPLPELDRPNPSLSSHHMSRSFSADTSRHRAFQPMAVQPSPFGSSGHSDGSGNGTAPGPYVGPKGRAATRDNNTLLPTVQEILPHGFRYALRHSPTLTCS